MRQNLRAKFAQSDTSTLAVLRTCDARLLAAPSPSAKAAFNTLTLRSAIKSAFSETGGDTLGYVKAERQRTSAIFDAAAETLDECEQFGLAILSAVAYLQGETKNLDANLPAEYATQIVALKAARDASGTTIAPNTEASLRTLAKHCHAKLQHHRALHSKRWAAFRIAFNKGCGKLFEQASKVPGNAKSHLHARAAGKYKAQAERAKVQYTIAHKKFEEVRNG